MRRWVRRSLDVTFPYVSLYKAPEEPDIIIIASDQPVIQKSIGRFSTDPALVKEFKRIHRDPEFFGERNFLFTSKMVRNMMKNIDPNSIFTPMVDNKAEEARFVHSEAHIVQVFDSCEICWPEYLDSADYALRRPAKVKAMMDAMEGDSYRKLGIEAYLAKVDTPVVERSPEWKKFREEYIEWVRGVPMEARDTNAVYMKVRDLVNAGMFPASFVDEFNILEVARTKNYAVAAKLVADFYEKYEVKDMDEFFLRNAILDNEFDTAQLFRKLVHIVFGIVKYHTGVQDFGRVVVGVEEFFPNVAQQHFQFVFLLATALEVGVTPNGAEGHERTQYESTVQPPGTAADRDVDGLVHRCFPDLTAANIAFWPPRLNGTGTINLFQISQKRYTEY